jgi:deoxyribodipyrimidine photolyase-related protein
MTLWLLGNQLSRDAAPLASEDSVLLIEADEFGERLPYHSYKLTLVFSAMRHFRDDLREAGYDVTYVQAETFREGLEQYYSAAPDDDLVLMRPAAHRGGERLQALVESVGGQLTLVENDLFVTTPDEWEAWADGRGDSYRQEHWYRHVRRETGVLMEDGDPVGGEWNYDDHNRETPPDDWSPPPTPTFEPDEITREVHDFVTERYDHLWGNHDLDEFCWPVTRTEALQALEQFVTVRLPAFGPYQDAMVDGEWALSHSLLSPAINLGLLDPLEVVERVTDAYEERGVAAGAPAEEVHREGTLPLNSVEGFVRQLIGWREFMRHVYREAMPELSATNQLDATRELPELYYTGETDMHCMSEAVGHVWDRGYAHHIERLMLLSNFATLYGADPHELDEWFRFGFVDAYDWVTTPNTVGMGSFATDLLSSKPYTSSANYVDKMSDHCASCPYYHTKTTGERACPFNSLYWDFLKENEETLRNTGRMGLMYSHVDRKSDEEWTEIRERAATVREMARRGEL